MNLSELKEKPVSEIVKMAAEYGIENTGRMRKQDIIFSILSERVIRFPARLDHRKKVSVISLV